MKHTGVIGKNSIANERAHEAHGNRARIARDNYFSTTGEEQQKYYKRIVRFYPEFVNDKGEVE